MKKIMKTLPIALALSTSIANADTWSNIQLANTLNTNSPANYTRLEGGINTDNFSGYGFADINPSTDYGELRVNSKEDIVFGFKPNLEINIGEEMKDIVRLGLIKDFSLGEKGFGNIKLSPIELTDSGNGKKSQIEGFVSYDIGNKLNFELLGNYNVENGKSYIEPTLHYKVVDDTTIFLRSRSFGEIDSLDSITTIGVSLSF